MKLVALLKAVISQDMDMFQYTSGKNASKFKKIMLPIFLFITVCIAIGTYAYNLADILHSYNLTYIMLSIFIAMVTILAFIEGIYKSQGILFEAKDNDLLFSLPIKKSTILFSKIFKLLLFEYIYNLMFILPAFVIYIYFEKPNIYFYLISLLLSFLIPIIPTVLSSFLGYYIKIFSDKFKAKKIIQLLLTSIIFIIVFWFSFNIDNILKDIAKEATSINDLLTKIYYPIGAYINLINKFNIIIFIKLILINLIPLVLFIIIGQKNYFKIVSNTNNLTTSKPNKKIKIKVKKPIISLTYKELKRYFSSPVYILNTGFGIVLVLVLTIGLYLKGPTVLTNLLKDLQIIKVTSIELLYYSIVFFSLILTSITSSSISLEGKTINITKTLPINYKLLFKAKILHCFIIELPLVLISEIIFLIKFKISKIFFIQLLSLTIISIFLTSVIGLIINLKYPKLNASNDTEVVKQSMSSMLAVFISFIIFIISMLGIIYLNDKVNLTIIFTVHIFIVFISALILYLILMKKGPKAYQKLNI